jgi:hypothetical protein
MQDNGTRYNVQLPCTSKDNVTDRISVMTDICSSVALTKSHICHILGVSTI